MSELSAIVDRINTISTKLLDLEGRIKALQAKRDATSLKLEQLQWAQRDAHENGHKWPGPTRESLEAARVAYRNARIDLEHAQRDQARLLEAMDDAEAELRQTKIMVKREQRNQPLTGRPFAALLG